MHIGDEGGSPGNGGPAAAMILGVYAGFCMINTASLASFDRDHDPRVFSK